MSTFQTLIESYGDLANRYAKLEAERDAFKKEIDALKWEKFCTEGRVNDTEVRLDLTLDAVEIALELARSSGNYKDNLEALAKRVKSFKI